MVDYPGDPLGLIYGNKPYEKIGRCVFQWGRFEQTIISQTSIAHDPLGKSPFTMGPIEQGFDRKWNAWANAHRRYAKDGPAFEEFFADVKKLSNFRDDLAHSMANVFIGGQDGYCIEIFKRTPDWRTKWDRWFAKFGHLPLAARPKTAPYTAQNYHYYPNDFEKFLEGVERADQVTKELSAALVRAAQP